MFSERRYRLYDRTSHLFLTYMSLLMIIAVIFSGELADSVPHLNEIRITLALFVFTTSLIIYGFKFSEIADKHRNCYLKLQALGQNFEKETDPAQAYQDILSDFPNHASWDYDDLILDRTLFRKSKLNVGDTEITWTVWILLKKVIRLFVFGISILILPVSVTALFFSGMFL